MAVAVTSLLFLPAYFIFNFSAWVLMLDPATLSTLAWGIVATRVLLPLGFLIALLQADRFAATALRTMLERLAARPTPRAVAGHGRDGARRSRAAAGYRDPATGRFRDLDGDELSPHRPRTPVAPGCRSTTAMSRSRRWSWTRPSPRIRSSCARR